MQSRIVALCLTALLLAAARLEAQTVVVVSPHRPTTLDSIVLEFQDPEFSRSGR